MKTLQDIVLNFYQQQQQQQQGNLMVVNNNKWAITTATATTIFIYYVIKNIINSNKDKNDATPIVPYRWPILGSSAEYFKDKKKFAKEKAELYGPVFRVHLLGQFTKVQSFVARTTAFTLGGTSFTENKELLYLLENVADECSKRFLMPSPARALLPWWNTLYKNRNTFAKESIQRVRNGLKEEVKRRLDIIHNKNEKEKKAPDDVLQFILTNHFKDENENDILDGLTIWFFSMTFLSVSTTSGILMALLHSLANFPQYVSELLEEQEHVIQQKKKNNTHSSLDADDYKKLVKLDSYIREVFRHMDDFGHPHVNITKNNVVLSNGTIIRPGEEVFTNFWHLNFDPTSQPDLEDLEEFKPFRFVGRGKQSTKCSNDYLPFGLGRHACPGN
ncbi:hypothetical protein INT45_014154 [Circinella minor]|uniref:Cytochrome P450 n=1 Tax=Circinella minor TaxID=1195481 RepID=A0A8H7RXR5_9FUNG|nr:hypothetical protein INT45_014154 [Circinella minor]